MATPDLEHELMSAVRAGLSEAVTSKLGGYNSPLDKMLTSVVKAHDADIRSLLTDAIGGAIRDVTWREQIAQAVRHKLASLLIQRFGGELEKQVNQLKSDPTTRARITLAIEQIVKESTT